MTHLPRWRWSQTAQRSPAGGRRPRGFPAPGAGGSGRQAAPAAGPSERPGAAWRERTSAAGPDGRQGCLGAESQLRSCPLLWARGPALRGGVCARADAVEPQADANGLGRFPRRGGAEVGEGFEVAVQRVPNGAMQDGGKEAAVRDRYRHGVPGRQREGRAPMMETLPPSVREPLAQSTCASGSSSMRYGAASTGVVLTTSSASV